MTAHGMRALPDDIDEVDSERKAAILMDRIAIDSRRHERRREWSFTPREALTCLAFEALHVAVCSSNLAQGLELSPEDHERLWLASFRATAICEEALACR